MRSVAEYSEYELLGAIEGLLEDGEIESGTPAFAIARQPAHQARASSQQAIYDRAIIPALERRPVDSRGPAKQNTRDRTL